MGLKDNFRQAAKELMETPGRQQEGSNSPNPDAAPQSSAPLISAPQGGSEQGGSYPPAGGQVSIIAAGTVIRGSIQTEGSLDLYGEVQGDILGQGDLTLRGRLTGNAIGNNMDLRGIRVKGNLRSAGAVIMDDNSIVQGDVQAQEVVLNGKIEGNVSVSQRLALESRGIIFGDVTAARLVVAEGGVLQGEVHIGGAQAGRVVTTQEEADRMMAEQQAAQQSEQPEQPEQPEQQQEKPSEPVL